MHNVYNVSLNIYPAYYMVRKPNLNQKKNRAPHTTRNQRVYYI